MRVKETDLTNDMLLLLQSTMTIARTYTLPAKNDAESLRTRLYSARKGFYNKDPSLRGTMDFEALIKPRADGKFDLLVQRRLADIEQYLTSGPPISELIERERSESRSSAALPVGSIEEITQDEETSESAVNPALANLFGVSE